MKSELAAKVERTIRKFHMAEKGERLLVGLSGGADSAALLLCLNELGYDVSACHVNHCIRGEEADRDQHFCERLCEGLGIGITVRRVDVPAYCRANPVSEEEGARLLRYNALQEISADKICTAHNLDDCLETTLFNLARGAERHSIYPACKREYHPTADRMQQRGDRSISVRTRTELRHRFYQSA